MEERANPGLPLDRQAEQVADCLNPNDIRIQQTDALDLNLDSFGWMELTILLQDRPAGLSNRSAWPQLCRWL